MKGAFLLIAIVLIITLSRGEITPPSSFGQAFSAQGQNNLPDRIADQFSNFTVEWDLNSGIKFARQLQCSPALQELAAAQPEITVFPEAAARAASRGAAVPNATIPRSPSAAQTEVEPVPSVSTALGRDAVRPGSSLAAVANAMIQRSINAARAVVKSGPVQHRQNAAAWGFVSTLPHSDVAKMAHAPRKIVAV
ncbi:MAG: hypothetical protein M1839_009506 [Geoglossum umbratile]|nr:MAG: hypothetical protein M1839_009506 [Geoglossum umbratile]